MTDCPDNLAHGYKHSLPQRRYKWGCMQIGHVLVPTAEEHGWNLYAPGTFNAVLRAWIEDRPLPVGPELHLFKDIT